ncbi:MAG: ribonuclease H-like domain-containing protein [Patescibacteria group bacterium]
MNKLVFDIETAGEKFEDLDETSKELLDQRFKKRAQTEEELELFRTQLSFYPETSKIVAIGMLNPDTEKGTALYLAEKAGEAIQEKGIEYQPITSEKELLEKFWQIALSYEEFITFNGRGFDLPVLMVRSAVNGIRPAKNLMHNRYLSYQPTSVVHIDLFDQLSFYGARYNALGLHFWARAFGINSPKEELSGEKVTEYFYRGKRLEIAKYCMNDVFATAELYKKWDKYLRF